MGYDVEGVVVSHQRADVQTRNVLDAVLIAYAFHQLGVAHHLLAQSHDTADEVGMCGCKLLAALLIAGVKQRAVGQDDACRAQHLVAVGMYATVHARGIVAHYAAHHGTVDRCRVGRENAAIRLEQLIDAPSGEPRPQSNHLTVGTYGEALPHLAGHYQHRVAQALTRQRRSCRTKSERNTCRVAGFDDVLHLALAL